jgi:hypothetical protein
LVGWFCRSKYGITLLGENYTIWRYGIALGGDSDARHVTSQWRLRVGEGAWGEVCAWRKCARLRVTCSGRCACGGRRAWGDGGDGGECVYNNVLQALLGTQFTFIAADVPVFFLLKNVSNVHNKSRLPHITKLIVDGGAEDAHGGREGHIGIDQRRNVAAQLLGLLLQYDIVFLIVFAMEYGRETLLVKRNGMGRCG